MKIAIIGSTAYAKKMDAHRVLLKKAGHEVLIPFFDDDDPDILAVCMGNRDNIKAADRIDIFWDQRSIGTILDFGMAFALEKPIKLIYVEKKTILEVMQRYEQEKGGA